MRAPGRSVRALGWSASDLVSRQAVQLGATMVLARLLSPRDFGVIAVLVFVAAIASVLSEGGLGLALVSSRTATHRDESTVFWLNLIVGCCAGVVVVASGPVLSAFLGLPSLSVLAIPMGISVAITALGSIHQALLTKSLDFRSLLVANLLGTVAAVASAIAAAVMGAGVWALAVHALVLSIVTTSALWVVSPWRPEVHLDLVSAKKLYSFGGFTTAAALADAAYGRVYTLFLGRSSGPVDVGYYTRADQAQQVPTNLLSSIVGRVALPLFSESAQDAARLRAGFRLTIRSLLVVNVPVTAALGALAAPVVGVLYGDGWGPAVPVLQILALGSTIWPVHVISQNVLMAQGHARLVWRVELVKKSVGIALLAVATSFGMLGFAWASVTLGFVGFVINAHYAGRFLDYGAVAQLRDCSPMLLATVPVALGAHVLSSAWPAPDLLKIMVLGPAVVGCSLASLHLAGAAAPRELLGALRSRRSPSDSVV